MIMVKSELLEIEKVKPAPVVRNGGYMETQHLDRRFGVSAVRMGFVTAEQVVEALRIQVMEDVEKGKHRLVGLILLEQGLITLSQIERVLASIGKNLPLLKEQ